LPKKTKNDNFIPMAGKIASLGKSKPFPYMNSNTLSLSLSLSFIEETFQITLYTFFQGIDPSTGQLFHIFGKNTKEPQTVGSQAFYICK